MQIRGLFLLYDYVLFVSQKAVLILGRQQLFDREVPGVDWATLPNGEWVRTWPEYHDDVRDLSRLLSGTSWPAILAIPRGALTPASLVARELNIRLIENLCLSSYDHKEQGREVRVLKPIGTGFLSSLNLGPARKLLVIDDLTDTGATFGVVRRELGPYAPFAHFAAVYAKPMGKGHLDTYVREVPQNIWIRQPWDMAYKYSKPMSGIDD